MNKFAVFGLLLVLLTCCTKSHSVENDKMDLYLQMQETVVDMEEDLRHLAAKEPDDDELSDLYSRLSRMSEEIETPKEAFKEDSRNTQELPSPKDRIKEDQIDVYSKRVVINIDKAYRGYLLDTNSMDPVLDAGTTTLAVRPYDPEDIEPGDIILFKSTFSEYNIVHRVIHKDRDEHGIYYITKGDNNAVADPGKVRFENVTAVIIGVLY